MERGERGNAAPGVRARLPGLFLTFVVLVVFLGAGLASPRGGVPLHAASPSLLPGLDAGKIDAIGIEVPGRPAIDLRRTADGWQAAVGGTVYPAAASRIAIFLRIVTNLERTTAVSPGSGRPGDLGLAPGQARLLVLRAAGAPGTGLLVGNRGPGGDGDYVQVRGAPTVFLVRGPLAFFLGQEPSYWYELHVLPGGVQGDSIASIQVEGALTPGGPGQETIRGGYVLRRDSVDGPDAWTVAGRRADPVAAGAMAGSLAQLQGTGFAGRSHDAPSAPRRGGRLVIIVTTAAGATSTLTAVRGPGEGTVLLSADWSPWLYLVGALPLRRAVLPASVLTAR
jgi:hypothetical protein